MAVVLNLQRCSERTALSAPALPLSTKQLVHPAVCRIVDSVEMRRRGTRVTNKARLVSRQQGTARLPQVDSAGAAKGWARVTSFLERSVRPGGSRALCSVPLEWIHGHHPGTPTSNVRLVVGDWLQAEGWPVRLSGVLGEFWDCVPGSSREVVGAKDRLKQAAHWSMPGFPVQTRCGRGS